MSYVVYVYDSTRIRLDVVYVSVSYTYTTRHVVVYVYDSTRIRLDVEYVSELPWCLSYGCQNSSHHIIWATELVRWRDTTAKIHQQHVILVSEFITQYHMSDRMDDNDVTWVPKSIRKILYGRQNSLHNIIWVSEWMTMTWHECRNPSEWCHMGVRIYQNDDNDVIWMQNN